MESDARSISKGSAKGPALISGEPLSFLGGVNPKTGEISRKEINAKIASEILHKSVDKELLLQKVEQAPQLKEEAIMDRLKAIQQELSKNAKKHKPINVIDVEVIDDGQTGRLQAESDQHSVGSDEVERGDGSEVREGSGG